MRWATAHAYEHFLGVSSRWGISTDIDDISHHLESRIIVFEDYVTSYMPYRCYFQAFYYVTNST